jgi:hypothetical protein
LPFGKTSRALRFEYCVFEGVFVLVFVEKYNGSLDRFAFLVDSRAKNELSIYAGESVRR